MAAAIERIKEERNSKEVSELRSIVDYLHQQWQRDYIMYQLKQDELICDTGRVLIVRMQSNLDGKMEQEVLQLKELI
jgi:hypothetical protein